MEKKLKHKNVCTAIIIVLLVLTLAFIWGHSMKSIPESQAESQSVLGWIRPLLEFFIGEGNATDHIVRKLAHFAEFDALGVELMALIAVRKRTKLQDIVNCLFAGLSAAVIDETIQIFSDRGSQVQDVLIDFAGCCAGMLFTGLIVLLIGEMKRNPKRLKNSITVNIWQSQHCSRRLFIRSH